MFLFRIPFFIVFHLQTLFWRANNQIIKKKIVMIDGIMFKNKFVKYWLNSKRAQGKMFYLNVAWR